MKIPHMLDALLASKGGQVAFLSYTTHALAENRHGLIVDVHTHLATGTAEREAAQVMLKCSVRPANRNHKPTLAADRGYDTAEFVGALTELHIASHVAARIKDSAVPEYIKATEGYAVSLRRRKMIEEAFVWVQDIDTLRRLMARGLNRIRTYVLLNFAAYNLTRLGNLLAS